MLRLLFLLLTIISIQKFSSQTIQEYDKILKIENLKFNTNEIRVYKKYATSTGLKLFRLYQDDKENWKAELYETIAPSDYESDEITIGTKKSKLNSLKNLELIWAQILDTNIIYLPQWKNFEYKLKKHNRDYQIIDGEVSHSTSTSHLIRWNILYCKN